jgi:hypothetical protein
MTTIVTKNKPTTVFPDIPRDVPFVDENRMMTDPYRLFFDQLAAALQTNLKPEGFVIPQQTTTNMNLLKAMQSFTNVIYNTTANLFYGNLKQPTNSGTQQVWLPFAMITSFAGNPNGNVAGQFLWFCWDTTDNNLFICTTAGTTTTAVWTTVYTGLDAMLLLSP